MTDRLPNKTKLSRMSFGITSEGEIKSRVPGPHFKEARYKVFWYASKTVSIEPEHLVALWVKAHRGKVEREKKVAHKSIFDVQQELETEAFNKKIEGD
jgi:hypothetical protein